jgi:hypothetical protein
MQINSYVHGRTPNGALGVFYVDESYVQVAASDAHAAEQYRVAMVEHYASAERAAAVQVGNDAATAFNALPADTRLAALTIAPSGFVLAPMAPISFATPVLTEPEPVTPPIIAPVVDTSNFDAAQYYDYGGGA